MELDVETRPNHVNQAAALGLDLRDAKKVEDLAQAARANLDRMKDRGADAVAGARYRVSRFAIPVTLADGGALLFNSRTRALTLLSAAESRAWRQLAQAPFGADKVPDRLFLQTLRGNGHVVGENDNELAWVRRNYENTRHRKHVLNLTIAPTMACNFACGYCYQGLDKPVTKMSPEIQEQTFKFITSQDGVQSISVVWYGGEPLMGKEAVFNLSDRLIAWCDKHKVNYSSGMVSNTYLLTADVARQLYSRRVKWVQVTLDGDQEVHDQMRPLVSGRGTYDTILSNIEAVLDETPIAVNVRVNVGMRNIDRVDAMLDQMKEKKLNQRGNFRVYFAKIEASTPEAGGAAEQQVTRLDFSRRVLDLEAKARRLGFSNTVAAPGGFSGMCVAASEKGYVITGTGDLHKCWETAHDVEKRIGTIFEPEKIAQSVNASIWSEWTPFDNSTCTSCKILPMCGGHCAQRFVYTTEGQTALPCPSWKWNTAEYIFARALGLGVVKQHQWLDSQSTALAHQSGNTHTQDSLDQANAKVLERVSAKHGRAIDRAMVMAGEPALNDIPGEPALNDIPGEPALNDIPGKPALNDIPGKPALNDIPGKPVARPAPQS